MLLDVDKKRVDNISYHVDLSRLAIRLNNVLLLQILCQMLVCLLLYMLTELLT
jgi:hypothetical protein